MTEQQSDPPPEEPQAAPDPPAPPELQGPPEPPEQPMPATAVRSRRSWSRRRNALGVRNGRLLILLVIALAVGVSVTLLTAYLGIR